MSTKANGIKLSKYLKMKFGKVFDTLVSSVLIIEKAMFSIGK